MPQVGQYRGNPDHAPCAFDGTTVQANSWYYYVVPDEAGGERRRWFAGGRTSRAWRKWKDELLEQAASDGFTIIEYNGQQLHTSQRAVLDTPAPRPDRGHPPQRSTFVDDAAEASSADGSQADSSIGASTAAFFTDGSGDVDGSSEPGSVQSPSASTSSAVDDAAPRRRAGRIVLSDASEMDSPLAAAQASAERNLPVSPRLRELALSTSSSSSNAAAPATTTVPAASSALRLSGTGSSSAASSSSSRHLSFAPRTSTGSPLSSRVRVRRPSSLASSTPSTATRRTVPATNAVTDGTADGEAQLFVVSKTLSPRIIVQQTRLHVPRPKGYALVIDYLCPDVDSVSFKVCSALSARAKFNVTPHIYDIGGVGGADEFGLRALLQMQYVHDELQPRPFSEVTRAHVTAFLSSPVEDYWRRKMHSMSSVLTERERLDTFMSELVSVDTEAFLGVVTDEDSLLSLLQQHMPGIDADEATLRRTYCVLVCVDASSIAAAVTASEAIRRTAQRAPQMSRRGAPRGTMNDEDEATAAASEVPMPDVPRNRYLSGQWRAPRTPGRLQPIDEMFANRDTSDDPPEALPVPDELPRQPAPPPSVTSHYFLVAVRYGPHAVVHRAWGRNDLGDFDGVSRAAARRAALARARAARHESEMRPARRSLETYASILEMQAAEGSEAVEDEAVEADDGDAYDPVLSDDDYDDDM